MKCHRDRAGVELGSVCPQGGLPVLHHVSERSLMVGSVDSVGTALLATTPRGRVVAGAPAGLGAGQQRIDVAGAGTGPLRAQGAEGKISQHRPHTSHPQPWAWPLRRPPCPTEMHPSPREAGSAQAPCRQCPTSRCCPGAHFSSWLRSSSRLLSHPRYVSHSDAGHQ